MTTAREPSIYITIALVCSDEHTKVPGSSERTWTPFHHPLEICLEDGYLQSSWYNSYPCLAVLDISPNIKNYSPGRFIYSFRMYVDSISYMSKEQKLWNYGIFL